MLTEWLDRENIAAPEIRSLFAGYSLDASVPPAPWIEALERSRAYRPDMPAVGLAIGAGFAPRHGGTLAYLMMACATLSEAFAMYDRYQRLTFDYDQPGAFSSQYPDVETSWPPSGLGKLYDEVFISLRWTYVQRLLGQTGKLTALHFPHEVYDAEAQAYEAFFGCPITFGSCSLAMRYSLDMLHYPIPTSDPALRMVLERLADKQLAALPAPGGIRQDVQTALAAMLPAQALSFERIAEKMAVAPRTLRRRLDREGVTWQQLLDQVREQLAEQYLRDRNLTTTEIAKLLGYNNQASFSNAFRRWTGISLRKMRSLG